MNLKKKAIAVAIALAFSSPMHASGIPTFDAANVIQSTITALNSVEQLMNQVKMVANQAQQLKTLDGAIMGSLNDALGGQANDITGLLRDVQSMKFDWENSKREYESLFGDDGAWKDANPAAYADYLDRLSQQVKGAARTATQSQQVINNVEKYNRANQRAIDAAAGADGDVRQLQSANLQLSTITAQLGDLAQVTATQARVEATQALAAQAKEDADRATIKRMTDPSNIILNNPIRNKEY